MASFVISFVTAVDTSGASDSDIGTCTEGIARLSTAIDVVGGNCGGDDAVFDWEI